MAHRSRALPAPRPLLIGPYPSPSPLLSPAPSPGHSKPPPLLQCFPPAQNQIRGKESPPAANYKAEGGHGGGGWGDGRQAYVPKASPPHTHTFPPPLLPNPGPTKDAARSQPSAVRAPVQTWRPPQVRAAAGWERAASAPPLSPRLARGLLLNQKTLRLLYQIWSPSLRRCECTHFPIPKYQPGQGPCAREPHSLERSSTFSPLLSFPFPDQG